MKKASYFTFFAGIALLLSVSACTKDEIPQVPEPVVEQKKDTTKNPADTLLYRAIIVNYGNYGKTNGELSALDIQAGTIAANQYEKANGLPLGANIQSAKFAGNTLYLMSNSGDRIDVLDASTFKVKGNPIFTTGTMSIAKPRNMAIVGEKAFVTCWGSSPSWSKPFPGSYIAQINTAKNSIEKTIALPGSPEGIAYTGTELAVGLNFSQRLAFVNPETGAVRYGDSLQSVTSFPFMAGGSLWTTCVSTFSVPTAAKNQGLAKIDPATGKIISMISVENLSYENPPLLSADEKKAYLLCKEAYPKTGTEVVEVELATGTVRSVLSGKGFYGLGYDAQRQQIYVLKAGGGAGVKNIAVYSTAGDSLKSFEGGINPLHVIFK